MITQSLFYDAIVIIYALSLLLTFSDFICANRSVKQMGEGLLLFVWLLQSAVLAASLYEHRELVFAFYDTLFLFSWLLVALALAAGRLIRMDMFAFPVSVIGFVLLALRFISIPDAVPSVIRWQVSGELLFVHIVLAVGSYAAFLAGAVLSGMYLFLHRQLKSKHWNPAMKRMPSLEKLEAYTYRTVLFGLPMLLLSLVPGFGCLIVLDNPKLLADIKVANSIIILGVYACWLIQRKFLRSTGYKLAVWNLVGFGVVLVNFILSDMFSQFHHWVWM